MTIEIYIPFSESVNQNFDWNAVIMDKKVTQVFCYQEREILNLLIV